MPTKQKPAAKQPSTQPKYGLDFQGMIRVFAKSKSVDVKGKKVIITDHWLNLSRKDENEQYENLSVKLQFKKDDSTPENNSMIVVKGFLTMSGRGDYIRPALMITEWDYVEE